MEERRRIALRRLHRLWMALGWLCLAIIAYLSLTPSPLNLMHAKYADKLEHMLAYSFLMLWFCQDYRRRLQRQLLALSLIMLGISMEALQDMTGYRSFEYGDMLANSIGVLLGWAGASTRLGGQIGIKLEDWFFK
jgi:VanZ family protein